MKVSTLLAAGAVSAVSLISLASCSNDKKLVLPGNTPTATDVSGDTLPGISLPDTIDVGTLPANIPGISGDCASYYTALSSMFTGATEQSLDTVDNAFEKLKSDVPDDLEDDLDKVREGYTKLAAIYKENNYDFAKVATDPVIQELYTDTEFMQSFENISTWLEEKCGQG